MGGEAKIAPNEANGSAFIIHEAHEGDHRQLLRLARELDSINLPTDSRKLHDAIACSMLSFRGRVRNRSRATYIFCVEERRTGAIVAASMLIAKHGTPEAPHYYLEMDSDDRYSHTLRKMFRHPYLRLRYSMDGPTEIGGLIVTHSMRGHPDRIGKQISWVRFLYMAKHPGRFERQVVAEMLAPMLPDHGNVFWDHYGRRITGLSFREADILSTHDKEFIRALFPDTPLYTFLLPDQVRDSLGATGEASRGAVRLLEQAGMRFLKHIDPFDGGPYYGAEIADLRPVKEWQSTTAISGEPTPERARSYLLGCDDARGFRAIQAQAEMVEPGRIKTTAATLAALGVNARTRVEAVPLP